MPSSFENFVQFVPRPQLKKNGNLLLKTGSSSASSESRAESQIVYCPELHHVTLQYLANFLPFLKSKNIGSPDGNPTRSSTEHLVGRPTDLH